MRWPLPISDLLDSLRTSYHCLKMETNMFIKRTSGILAMLALALSFTVFPASDALAKKRLKGAAIGAGVGALVGGKKGMAGGAVAGAILGG